MLRMDNSKLQLKTQRILSGVRIIMSLIGIPEFGFEKCSLVNLYTPNGDKVRADFFRQAPTELKFWQKIITVIS